MTFAARTNGSAAVLSAYFPAGPLTYAIGPGAGSPASMTFQTDSEFWATADSFDTIQEYQFNWLTGGTPSECKLVYTISSGSFSAGAPASGTNMGSPLTFTRGATPGSFQSVTASFQIQRVSDSSVLAGPVTITLECDNN